MIIVAFSVREISARQRSTLDKRLTEVKNQEKLTRAGFEPTTSDLTCLRSATELYFVLAISLLPMSLIGGCQSGAIQPLAATRLPSKLPLRCIT